MAALPATADDRPFHLGLLGINTGTTIPADVGFAAISLTNQRDPINSDGDGTAVFGYGFGDPVAAVGGQVSLNITSLTDDFGDSGYLALKFSRQLAAGSAPVYGSLEFGQLANWGDDDGRDVTTSLTFTRFSQIDRGPGRQALPVMMSLGAGSHLRNGDTDPAVFGGIGVGISPSTALSIAWTGDDLTVGGSFKIAGAENLAIGIGIDDATDRNDNRRLVVSFGYRFDNLFGG